MPSVIEYGAAAAAHIMLSRLPAVSALPQPSPPPPTPTRHPHASPPTSTPTHARVWRISYYLSCF
jgi:hypothetical protein